MTRRHAPPEQGPRILFFSGGTALRETARQLKQRTHRSIHLVTPFDSGGSSARLREAFGMPSVGDLRNRMMALGDETVPGNPEIFSLVNQRLAAEGTPQELADAFDRILTGDDPRVAAIHGPARATIDAALRTFADARPAGFDLRRAKIGNLVLAGRYLEVGRDLDRVVDEFTEMAHVRGVVRPVTNAEAHLSATLEDGTERIGQHRITAMTARDAPIRSIRLIRSLEQPETIDVPVPERVVEAIRSADLIVYPIGSFYTSVCANLLPSAISAAVRASRARRVYVPNTDRDPEQRTLGVRGAVAVLESLVGAGAVDAVLVDRAGGYPIEPELDAVARDGVEVLTGDLVAEATAPAIDPRRLADALFGLAG